MQAPPTWGSPALPFALEAQLAGDPVDPAEFEWLQNLLQREGVGDASADDPANETSDLTSDTSDTSNTTCDTFSTGLSAPGAKHQLSGASDRSSAASAAWCVALSGSSHTARLKAFEAFFPKRAKVWP